MGKVPLMARQGTRYEPYKNSSRRRASPPPDSWGIHAGSQHAQLGSSIFVLLDDLNTRYGSRDLREIFRDHANQPGALGQAIETWIQYDEIRGPRQPEHTDVLETQHYNQCNWSNALGLNPGNESRTSRPPVGRPDARDVFPPRQYPEHPNGRTSDENHLQHSEDVLPQGKHSYWGEPSLPLAVSRSPGDLCSISPHCSPNGRTGDEVPGVQTSPGQSYPILNSRAVSHVTDSPPLSLLQLMRDVEAPPLVSLPPSGPSVVPGNSYRSGDPLVNGHDEQGMSRWNSEESVHAAFWETAGWTPENGYPGLREDGYHIPTYLKGKGRARLQGPNEGGETPEEQDSSRWNPPEPGYQPYEMSYHESRVSSTDGEFVSTRAPVDAEPQDEDSIPMALHQEGQQDEHEQRPPYPEFHLEPEPEPQPQLRRSARIKAKNKPQDAVPPKVKIPAKSTSRKRAIRKK